MGHFVDTKVSIPYKFNLLKVIDQVVSLLLDRSQGWATVLERWTLWNPYC